MTADIIKFKPRYELDCEKEMAVSFPFNESKVLAAAAKAEMDTAPSEYSAPDDGDCA